MNWFSKNSIISLIVEAMIFIGVISFGYNIMSDKLDTSERNLATYKGKVEQLELKNGELLTARDSYILDKSQLEEELQVTKKEVKELEKKLNSSLAYIAQIKTEVRIDTIEIVRDSIIYKGDNISKVLFEYNDEWFSIKGITDLTNPTPITSLYNINMLVPLTMGLTNDYKLFIQSPNPYVYFTDMDGAAVNGSILAPKKKKWNFSLQGGMGICYDIISKNIGVGPYGGMGISFNF